MKKLQTLGLLIVLALPLRADELQTPHVSVFGTAVTEVVPDKMTWSLRVETRGQALETVAEKHSQTVQSVLDFLKKEKIEEKAMQTSRMEFGENWEYQSSSRIRNGYIASTEISFKLTDLSAYGRLWMGLSKIPSVSVQGVSYDHTKRIQYQNETRQKAIVAAREKADAMARGLGAEIGDPIVIEDESPANDVWQMGAGNVVHNLRAVAPGGPEGAEVVAPGTIPVTMRVKLVFRLVAGKR